MSTTATTPPFVWRTPTPTSPIEWRAGFLRCALAGTATPEQVREWIDDEDVVQVGEFINRMREVLERVSGLQCTCGGLGWCPVCHVRPLLAEMDAAGVPVEEEPQPAEPQKRTCNRHDDCDAADEAAKARGAWRASHCHDEGCEDCFGS